MMASPPAGCQAVSPPTLKRVLRLPSGKPLQMCDESDSSDLELAQRDETQQQLCLQDENAAAKRLQMVEAMSNFAGSAAAVTLSNAQVDSSFAAVPPANAGSDSGSKAVVFSELRMATWLITHCRDQGRNMIL